MAKYEPLKIYLLGLPDSQNEVTLSFEHIERLIHDKLPESAYIHRAWWSNEEHGVHVSAKAWMGASWRVEAVDQKAYWVKFIRHATAPQLKTQAVRGESKFINTDKVYKITMFSANRPNKTLVIHKPNCQKIPWGKLSNCGCGDTGALDNQHWFCEIHITREDMDEFMDHRFWAILLCDVCF